MIRKEASIRGEMGYEGRYSICRNRIRAYFYYGQTLALPERYTSPLSFLVISELEQGRHGIRAGRENEDEW